MSSLFSCSSKQLQGTRGTGREGAEHSGSLAYIFTCSSSSSQPGASLRLRRGGERYPFGLCWMVFWGLVYISFLRKCLSSDSFLFVLFTNKTSADDLLLPLIFLGFLLGEELIQKVEIDETSFCRTCH